MDEKGGRKPQKGRDVNARPGLEREMEKVWTENYFTVTFVPLRM